MTLDTRLHGPIPVPLQMLPPLLFTVRFVHGVVCVCLHLLISCLLLKPPSQAFPSILPRVSLPSKAVECLWLKPVGTSRILPHLTSWKHQASLASLSRTILFFLLQQHLSFSFPFWQFFLKLLHGRPFFCLSFINCFFC